MTRLRAARFGGRASRVGIAFACTLVCAIVPGQAQRVQPAPVYGYEVVNVYPHDRDAFTQGLLFSDGSATLRFLDPQSLKVTGQVQVTDAGVPVRDLNELEFIDGQVYANVWMTDRIAMIAPDTGRVTGWINLAGLMPPSRVSNDAVLNGIAWDSQRRRLFVTGKLWPSLFEVRVRR